MSNLVYLAWSFLHLREHMIIFTPQRTDHRGFKFVRVTLLHLGFRRWKPSHVFNTACQECTVMSKVPLRKEIFNRNEISPKRNGETKWWNRVLFRQNFGEISPKRSGKKELFHRTFAKIARRNDTEHVLDMQHGHGHAAWTWTCSMDTF